MDIRSSIVNIHGWQIYPIMASHKSEPPIQWLIQLLFLLSFHYSMRLYMKIEFEHLDNTEAAVSSYCNQGLC